MGDREKMGRETESGKQGRESSQWSLSEARPGIEVSSMGKPTQVKLAAVLYSR